MSFEYSMASSKSSLVFVASGVILADSLIHMDRNTFSETSTMAPLAVVTLGMSSCLLQISTFICTLFWMNMDLIINNIIIVTSIEIDSYLCSTIVISVNIRET